MTNQEAAKILGQYDVSDIHFYTTDGKEIPFDKWSDAIEMAIKALEAQEAKTQLSAEGTTSDLISRQDAIDRINKQREHLQPDIYPQDKIGDAAYRICAEFIERLPSAHPEIEERKEESAQNVPKEDLISRKEAIDAVWEIRQKEISDGRRFHDYCSLSTAVDVIKDLPSAQPEPCEDCVSRQAAIDAALSAFSRGLLASPDIRKLPSVQPEPQWVPVSERLPEKYGNYLISIHGENEPDIGTINPNDKRGWSLCDANGFYWARDKELIVTAWMPLPEPYRAERRTDA